jgi:LemA protein
MTRAIHRLLPLLLLALLLPMLGGCGYNRIQSEDEAVKAQWSEVLNQYQRRAELIPNLVNTVRGYAQQEERVLTEITNARARVGSMQISAEEAADPAKLAQFQKAQGDLSSALSRLLVVTENYPDLKSNQNFLELQSQLEGTENRIAVARKRYIEAVQAYNTLVRRFPVNLTAKMFGYAPKPNFTVEDEAAISRAPTVDFGQPSPPPVPAPPPAAPAPPPPPADDAAVQPAPAG